VIRPVRMRALCVALLVASLLGACSAGAEPTPTFGVLGAACTADRVAAEQRAGVTVVELPLAWDRYEPAPGQVDTAYLDEVRDKIAVCRDAGMRIVLGLGLQYPPTWLRALPDALLRGSAGGDPADGGLDLVFNAQVRSAASAYLGRLAADLDLAGAGSGITAVRVGVSGTGEMAYPGPTDGGKESEYWAFGEAPQTGAGLADGAAVTPLPGWVPGQAQWRGAPVTSDQVDAWMAWYTGSLIDTVVWQVGRLRELGFTGDVHVPVAGRGILPADRAAAVAGLLDGRADPDGALERGLDYPRQFAVLAGLDGVVVDFTGLDDAQAVAARQLDPQQDGCRSDDTANLLERTDTAGWPGQRWTSALARQAGLTVVGENPGPPHAPQTGGEPTSDSSALQMQRAPDYARECGMTEFYWAFEDDLFTPGSGVDLNAYAARIAAVRHAAGSSA
jgi:hypothetical protein